MGFLSFGKKKDVIEPPSKLEFDLSKMETDLPPIGPGIPQQNPSPTILQAPQQQQRSQFDSFNNQVGLEELSKELPSLESPTFDNTSFDNNINNNMNSSLQDNSMMDIPPLEPPLDEPFQPSSPGKILSQEDIEEDVNHLFLADDTWKEPDWKNFEPYHEDFIDAPTPEDFGSSETAEPEDFNLEQTESAQETKDLGSLPSFDDARPASRRPSGLDSFNDEDEERPVDRETPMELFVKGSDYRKVYSEMDRINTLLGSQESKITTFQDGTKKEDEILMNARLKMDFIQKKMMLIDKRIFG